MTTWRSISIGVFLLLSCAMLALFFGRPSAGQAPAPLARPPVAEARYQLVVEKNIVYICDTHTGQIWCRSSPLPAVNKWTEIESPVIKKKKK